MDETEGVSVLGAFQMHHLQALDLNQFTIRNVLKLCTVYAGYGKEQEDMNIL